VGKADVAKPSTNSEKQTKKSLEESFGRPSLLRTDGESPPIKQCSMRDLSPLPTPYLPSSSLPKLQIVKRLIHGDGGGHVHNLQDLDTIIRHQEEKDYVTILREISTFSRVMRQLYRPMAEPHHAVTDTKSDNFEREIKRNDGPDTMIRELLHVLHSSLVNSSTNCVCRHEARLYLQVHQAADTELEVDMFLSTCQGPLKWQEAKCSVQRYVKR
jgi:hypothetical protein